MSELFEIPAHWQWATMGDIARVAGGSTPSSKRDEYWGGDIPWLAVSDLTGYREKQITGGARMITKAGYESCSTQLVPKGTVVFSSRAPIGYVAIAANALCTSQGFKSFVLEDGIDSEYVYWYLRYAKPLAESRGSGTTFKELSGKAAATLPIPVPPQEEQRRIVESIEVLMDQLDRAEMEITTAEELAETFDESALAGLLGDYPTVELGSVSGDIRYGTSIKCAVDASGPPVLRIPNVKHGVIDESDLKFATAERATLGDCFLQDGDLLFVRTNGSRDLIGRVAAVKGDSDAAFASYLIRVRPDQEQIDPDYAVLVLSSPSLRREIQARAASTAGQYNLNIPSLKSLPLPLPPLEEQKVVAGIVSAVRATKSSAVSDLVQARSRSSSLRRAILDRAFTGQLTRRQDGDGDAAKLIGEIAESRTNERPVGRKTAKKQRALAAER